MKDPKSMRIVFMGTPEFAVASLSVLVQDRYNVIGVITAPDKPAGRGQQVQMSAVKQFAVANHIPVLQPEKLKDPDFLQALQNLNADLQIVVAFRMLPEVVWNMPPLGTFNLHGSLLPKYRGAAPINRAIMNGERETGVTTFFLRQEIDTGAVIYRETIPIGPDETAGELHDKMMVIGAQLVKKTVDTIASGDVKTLEQDSLICSNEVIPDAPKIFRHDCKINWELNALHIHNHVRGLSPYPAAWTTLMRGDQELQMKVYSTAVVDTDSQAQIVAGKVSDDLVVQCGVGRIRITSLQPAGKKRMSAEEFLRGCKLTSSDYFI
jgi:methionyl-tRNA formyltransferase